MRGVRHGRGESVFYLALSGVVFRHTGIYGRLLVDLEQNPSCGLVSFDPWSQ